MEMTINGTFFRVELFICILATVLWCTVTLYYTISITKTKKKLIASGKTVPHTEGRLTTTVVCTFILLALPYLIFFKPYITAVLEGCAVLGAFNVLKERLAELKKAVKD